MTVSIRWDGMEVELETLDDARDFLFHVTGTRKLVVLERDRARISAAARPPARSLEDVAARHVPPVRLAATVVGEYPEGVATTKVAAPTTSLVEPEPATDPKQSNSPLVQHVVEATEETVSPAIPTPVKKRRGRPPGPKVAPGALTANRARVRGGEDVEPARPEQSETAQLQTRILHAFAQDERTPLPALATALFGSSTGRTIAKVKWIIEGLVAARRLQRLGVASYRIPESTEDVPYDSAPDEDLDEQEHHDDLDDQEGDEGSAYESAELRPATFDGPIPQIADD
jgi:hypothetical protein